MDSKRITKMIVQAYGEKFNLVQRPNPYHSRFQYYWDTYWGRLLERFPQLTNFKFQIAGGAVAVLLVLLSIFYFNRLVMAEHTWLTAQGQVQVFMQRRNDISVNLENAVQGYSSYERTVMEQVVKLRALIKPEDLKSGKLDDLLKSLKENSATAGKDAMPILGNLPMLQATAEQYPDLKLSANFQSLMAALIDVEKDLAQQRVKLNEAIYAYSELTTEFPSRYFASLFGFQAPDYFTATKDAQTLKPVHF
jgi:LemA protein